MKSARNFRDYPVWQDAVGFATQVYKITGDMPGHFLLRNPRRTKERWDGDEHSVAEMAELVQTALAFNARTQGRQRILDLGLTNDQVAAKLMEIYNTL